MGEGGEGKEGNVQEAEFLGKLYELGTTKRVRATSCRFPISPSLRRGKATVIN